MLLVKSVRRRVDRKILRFSLTIAAVGLVFVGALYAVSLYPSVQRWQRINQRALTSIKCLDTECDTADLSLDWDELPDYVVDGRNRYLIWFTSSSNEDPQHYSPLDFADTSFIREFRQPKSVRTPDKEVWRLFSREAHSAGKNIEVLVGFAEKSPTNMLDAPQSALPEIDVKLKKVADKIAEGLGKEGQVGSPSKLPVDGFEVVDSDDGNVIYRGPWVPSFLPKGKLLPSGGTKLYLDGSEVYVVQADVSGPIYATSLIHVGSIPWLVALAACAFLALAFAARWGARRFLRNYFAISTVRVPDLKGALQQGEGQFIEFKRGLSPDEPKVHSSDTEVLKSVTAFANTNDGAIFIGVDDRGQIVGLQLDYKKRDVFAQRVRNISRSHIRPIPPMQITFEEIRGLVVAVIAVARGRETVYVLNGAVYVRDGASDVIAQDGDYKRMLAES